MLLLLIFAFLAGIVTILSPCILPVLPIVLAGSVTKGRRRPFGIVLGFILSFTFFTLALSSIVKWTGLPADFLRTVSVVTILGFGVGLLFPQSQALMEKLFSKLTNLAPQENNPNAGFWGGIIIGLSLGLLWTPCVGPILASVITLAATNTVNATSILITAAYTLGTAIPMLIIIRGGRSALQKIPWLFRNLTKIQKGFGITMVLLAIGLFFNVDRKFQSYVLAIFPQYGTGLTQIETIPIVQKNLQALTGHSSTGPSSNNSAAAPDFIAGGQWFNSPPLTINQLKGKVVLVDFWTYTCINCIRTLPYLTDWYQKYHDQGLVIIGVHSPEFEFEKDPENVKKAIADFGIKYPVMQDNNLATWQAYQNQYWPAEYLIDAKGQVRHTHFGEGEYDQTEQAIQGLLKEAGDMATNVPISTMPDQTPTQQLSPETYLGSDRMQYFYPAGQLDPTQSTFNLSENLPKDTFSFGGEWAIDTDHATPGNNATLDYNFTASKVFIILRPGINQSGQVKVYLDGKDVSASVSGSDVKDGVVTVTSDKLYNLIDFGGKVENHILKLQFLTPGLEAYTFTFG